MMSHACRRSFRRLRGCLPPFAKLGSPSFTHVNATGPTFPIFRRPNETEASRRSVSATPGPMGRILVAGELGSEIIDTLAPLPGEAVLDKPGKGAFYATDLADRLARSKITTLVFAGVTTEVCVQTTMREANDRGFDCLLVEDATESYFPEFKAATLAMIRAQGAIVGWTATCEQTVSALHA